MANDKAEKYFKSFHAITVMPLQFSHESAFYSPIGCDSKTWQKHFYCSTFQEQDTYRKNMMV